MYNALNEENESIDSNKKNIIPNTLNTSLNNANGKTS